MKTSTKLIMWALFWVVLGGAGFSREMTMHSLSGL